MLLERRTGDSRNEDGLSPGGIVIHAALEIGSFAGDISLYLAAELFDGPPVPGRPGSSPELPSRSSESAAELWVCAIICDLEGSKVKEGVGALVIEEERVGS
jgi:hypothetical protein